MSTIGQIKQIAMDFVSKIPEFQKNLTLIDTFLGSLNENQLEKMEYFLKMTELLFMEKTLSGDYSCNIGITFQQLNNTDIPLFISDIKSGKYDKYF